jgi:hypothetical protein
MRMCVSDEDSIFIFIQEYDFIRIYLASESKCGHRVKIDKKTFEFCFRTMSPELSKNSDFVCHRYQL